MPIATKRSQPTKRPKARAKGAAAGPEFSLYFSGLCAFVQYDYAHGVSHMKVVLVDVTNPTSAMGEEFHSAALLVSQDYLDQQYSTRQPDFWFNGNATKYNQNMAGFLLHSETLTVAELDPATSIAPVPGSPMYCPVEKPPFYFKWIQEMPSNYDVMTQAAFQASYVDVIARVDLYDGELSTSHWPFSYKDRQKLLRWYLDSDQKPSGVKASRAIAEEIRFRKQFSAASKATINSGSGKVILQPKQGKMYAWIVNLPLIDLFIDRSQSATGERGKEHHFHHFYRLATAQTDLIPYPDPIAGNTCRQPVSGAANPRCPSTLFAGVAPPAQRPARGRKEK
jgi:hypothetical protein